MAPDKTLLIVDPDDRSLRVLEVSLRKAGFRVLTAETAEAADRAAAEADVDVIVTDTRLPDDSGFALARRLREQGAAGPAIVFLSTESSPDAKMQAIEAGADDFLAKPVLVKEIASRLRSLAASRDSASLAGPARDGRLRGSLANMGVVDLLQVMEAGAKSGVVHLSSDARRSGGYVPSGEARASLYFRDGAMVDAQLASLSGAEALYRVLLWEDGDFEVELADIDRPDLVQTPTQLLLLEGMRRVDEWSRLLEKLPSSPGKQPTVDYAVLGRRFGDVPAEVRSVVHLLDGERSLVQVVDQAPVDDATAVGIITRLNDEGVLVADEQNPAGASIEDWLSGDLSAPEPEIPSALGQAMIPSPQSPSDILAAAEPTAEPEPAPAARSSSIVLSRRTVPANRRTAPPAPAAPSPGAPASEAASARPPRLSIQRVSSVIQPASPVGAAEEEDPDPERTQASRVPAALARARVHRPLRAGEGLSRTSSTAAALRPSVDRPTSEVQAPAPALSDFSSEARDPFEAPPDEVPRGARPSGEPNLVIAAPGSAGAVPRPNGHRPAAQVTETEEAQAPRGSGGPSRPAQLDPPMTAAQRPEAPAGDETAAEEDFFSGASRPSTEPIAPGDIDWGDGPRRSVFERAAPWLVSVALLVVVAFLAQSLWTGRDTGGSESAEPAEASAEPQPTPAIAARASEEASTPASEGEAAGAEPTPPSPAETAPDEAAAEASPQPAPDEAVAEASPQPAPPEPAPSPPREPAEEDGRPDREAERPRPGRARAVLQEAEEALRGEDFAAAESRFRTALRLDRGSSAARSGLAYALLAEEDLRSARNAALGALRIDERDARAQLVLGTIAQTRGRLKRACRRYRRYLELGGGPMAGEIRSIVDQRCRS